MEKAEFLKTMPLNILRDILRDVQATRDDLDESEDLILEELERRKVTVQVDKDE